MWNQALGSVGLPSASGYQVLSGLTNPVFSQVFTKRDYAETIHGQITDQSVVPSELKSSGDLAVLQRSPTGEVFEYHKNQPLEVSSLNNEAFTFRVDKAWYWNLKLDSVDYKQIKDIGKWLKAFQDDAMQRLGLTIDQRILHDMAVAAHACNRGAKAGIRSGAYHMGVSGEPFLLNKDTFLRLLMLGSAVLDEQNAPMMGRFVVMPSTAKVVALSHPVLANAFMSGEAKSSLMTGRVPNLLDMSIYFTQSAPQYQDPQLGTITNYVIFGLKQATGYVTQLTKTEIIDKDPRSFSMYWRGLQLAGWGVIRPEYLAVAYVEVNLSNVGMATGVCM